MTDFPREGVSRRFEVTLPESHTIMQKLAFTAMIDAFGWNSVETTPDRRVVTNDRILETSESLFGSESAGVLANDLLTQLRRCGYGKVIDTRTYESSYYQGRGFLIKFTHGFMTPGSLVSQGLPLRDRLGSEIWSKLALRNDGHEQIVLPFELNVENGSFMPVDNLGAEYYRITPGPVTIDGLKGFVQNRGWNKVVPSGVIGQMVQVLATVAETEAGVNMVSDEAQFISKERLLDIAKRSGMTKAMVKGINNRIERAFYDQLQGRKSYLGGELNDIVFGGDCRVRSWSSGDSYESILTIDQIAIESIPNLANHYGGESPAIAFLKSFEVKPDDDDELIAKPTL